MASFYFGNCVSKDPPDIEDLLSLNPRTPKYANAVSSAVTKKVGTDFNHFLISKI